MGKCVMHANCQGHPMQLILARSSQFSHYWQSIEYFVNYRKTPIPDAVLEDCDLFLYQQLNEKWEDLASEKIISRLPKHAKAVSIPNILFRGYWPLIAGESAKEGWTDIFINTLLEKGLQTEEIVYMLIHTNLSKHYDFDSFRKKTIEMESKKTYVGLKNIADFIEENWKKEQLFTTPSHPCTKTILFSGNEILKALELNPISMKDESVQKLYCATEFFLPIHPFIGTHYNLPFVSKDKKYPVYGDMLTYTEYIIRYLECKREGVPLASYTLLKI